MEVTPHILFGKVMHQRLFPRKNGFVYGIYYLFFPLSKTQEMQDGWRFGVNRPGLMSFYDRDHGHRDGRDLSSWVSERLAEADIKADGEIFLMTMPRVFGHVFNPVSFYFCFDSTKILKAVICEVNNTFGETHSYICKYPAETGTDSSTWMQAEKIFHVSPFLERQGHYRFNFTIQAEKINIIIDYYAADGQKQLLTSVGGNLYPMTRQNRRRAFWRYPLVALVALARIHWHAVKLLAKGIRYVPKPLQNKNKTSISSNLTNL